MAHCAQGGEPLKRAIAPLLNQFNAIVGSAHSGHRSHGGEKDGDDNRNCYNDYAIHDQAHDNDSES